MTNKFIEHSKLTKNPMATMISGVGRAALLRLVRLSVAAFGNGPLSDGAWQSHVGITRVYGIHIYIYITWVIGQPSSTINAIVTMDNYGY